MSDEFNWIKLFQETCFNDKGESRISELETHWKVWMNSDKDAHDKIDDMNNRIIKSEHRIEYDTMAISWGEELRDSIKLNVKEIAELEKKLNKAILHWSNYGDMADLIRNDNARRLSELEDKQKEAIGNQLLFNQWCQEQLKTMKGAWFDTTKVEIAELKEEIEFNAENIGKHRISIEKLWTSYGELKEASGGEKEFKAGRRGGGDVHILNSKPPEPLIGCCYCRHNICKEEPCNSCFEFDKFERLPEPKCEYYDSEHDYCQRYNLVGEDNPIGVKEYCDFMDNINESREDEIKAMDRQIQAEIGTHIFVKREDLQLLCDIIFRNGFMTFKEKKDYFKIKEEYKIE